MRGCFLGVATVVFVCGVIIGGQLAIISRVVVPWEGGHRLWDWNGFFLPNRLGRFLRHFWGRFWRGLFSHKRFSWLRLRTTFYSICQCFSHWPGRGHCWTCKLFGISLLCNGGAFLLLSAHFFPDLPRLKSLHMIAHFMRFARKNVPFRFCRRKIDKNRNQNK